jgi:hypothetical protein
MNSQAKRGQSGRNEGRSARVGQTSLYRSDSTVVTARVPYSCPGQQDRMEPGFLCGPISLYNL